MSNKVIENLYYTKSDEWLKVEDSIGTIGITDYAQDQLGDIVYLEKIEKGKKLKQDETLTTIESVKAVSDIKTPVTGEVTEVNIKVIEDASIINKEPYIGGWMAKIKIENKDELKNLMSAQEYSEYRKE
ncbi:glycine cleavage system protein H [Candidatus Atribacteria bacterium RBG_19FT_COMBO_35_14]|uniref:Glycine cleavage system H protein n=1 Tax=Candidatus Sediminicultor quintus TaxID=1797291 RepID=A0A1F5ABL1_9BACT|nr:MAG: glycine cleavage system protein H [Candidatus Atribacteria bacterium RBG_19FT_COMBO_35_14]OGD32112.1 MAG: glycine cleavage system protein H [Candidatus Atribacteria bacterium RBG_16_35_8]